MRIRVIDFEASGLSPLNDEAGLVEIAYTDVVSTAEDLAGGPIDWIVEDGHAKLCNPGVPIPPETQAVHHIDDADVRDEPNWKPILRGLITRAREHNVSYFAAHGADFEALWFHPDWWGDAGPIKILDTYKSALRVWPEAPLHSNMGLRYWRRPDGIERAKALPAHRAGPDSYATAFLLRDLLNEGADIGQMLIWSDEPALTVRCMLGEYRNGGKGTPWPDVTTDMLRWILDKGFHDKPDIRFTATYHLNLRFEAARREAERVELNAQLRANGLPEEPGNPLMPPAGPPSSQGSLL